MKLTRLATIVVALASTGASIATALAIVGHEPASKASSARRGPGGPRAPLGLSGPARQTIAKDSATFTWRAADRRTAGYRCRLDHGRFQPCRSGVRYRSLKAGGHTFTLVAIARQGRRSHVAPGNTRSPPPSWSWTIEAAQTLTISGNAGAGLYPGTTPVAIDLSLDNPHPYALTMRVLTVAVAAVSAPNATPALPCTAADFTVANYTGPGFTAPSGASTLGKDRVPAAQWPTVAMIDRPADQDGCRGATVRLAYDALAIKASGRR